MDYKRDNEKECQKWRSRFLVPICKFTFKQKKSIFVFLLLSLHKQIICQVEPLASNDKKNLPKE